MQKIDGKELHELFEKLKVKNKEAYEELYKKYSTLVYQIAFSVLKNKENAEDIMQNEETYPAQIDCISIEEVENKAVNMYKKILEDLIKQDSALNENAKFIAIDFEKFSTNYKDRYEEDKDYRRNLSPNEKQAIIDFCKQYNENVIEANFEKLKEQGHFNEETKSLDGILISVEQIETIKEDKAVIRISKYRSALGAIMPKYELNLVNDYYWELKVLDTIIS